MRRILPLFALAVLMFVVSPALAQKDAKKDAQKDAKKDKGKPAARTTAHRGVVVSVEGDKLTMTTRGKRHTHNVPDSARVTIRGKKARLSDLKKGMRILVVSRAGKVVRIQSPAPAIRPPAVKDRPPVRDRVRDRPPPVRDRVRDRPPVRDRVRDRPPVRDRGPRDRPPVRDRVRPPREVPPDGE